MSMQVINQDHYAPGVEKAAMWCEQEDVENGLTGRSHRAVAIRALKEKL